jgi:hypothetical protein
MSEKIRINLPPLHPAQAELIHCPARFRVAACGRRFGKSAGAEIEALATSLQGGVVWYVCPDYTTSEDRWREILVLVNQLKQHGLAIKVSQERRDITMPSGGLLCIKSAHDPDRLRGSGLDLLIIEEAGIIPKLEYLWLNVLRPCLSDRQGRALFISSPTGEGSYLYKLYGFGLDPLKTDWQSFRFPTSSNPFIKASEIEAARGELPDRVYRQEYLAEFIPDGDGVFRGVLQACIAERQYDPIRGHDYIMAIDWGRSNDFTAISIIDQTDRREAVLDRFSGQMYSIQRDRIKVLYQHWRPSQVWAESNSIGGPNIESLQQDGIPVRAFNTTNASKAEAVNALALAIERTAQGAKDGIVLLDDPVGIQELQAFEYDTSPTGLMRFGARSGEHDDTVIARAIAVFHAVFRKPLRVVVSSWVTGQVYSDSDWEKGRR